MMSQEISQTTNKNVLIICLCLSITFVAVRVGARWFKIRRPPFAPEDIASYVALASFAIMCSLYLSAMATYYNATAVAAGELAPYASLERELVVLLKQFLAVQFFFWLTLWGAKCSLLFMSKALTTGLPMETRIWWAAMIFTIAAYVGCGVTQFLSCSSIHAWLTPNACNTPRDATAKAVALYFSLGVDLLTDMMVMAIPIRLLWNLRITPTEKVGLCLVFAVGILTMIVAIIRVVSLNAGISDGQVNTSWLILWGAIEGAVAIVVCCLPSFIIFIRNSVHPTRASDYTFQDSMSSSHNRQPTNNQSAQSKSHERSQSILLDDVEAVAELPDGGSKKSFTDGSITAAQSWTQSWRENRQTAKPEE